MHAFTSIQSSGFLESFAYWLGPSFGTLGIIESDGEMGFFCMEFTV